MNKIIIGLFSLAFLFLTGCQQDQQQHDNQAATQQQYRWKMVTAWPKNFPALGTSAELFVKQVHEMSAGRLQIKVYGAGELVPALQVFDAVSQGTAEMGHASPYYWKGKINAAQFFTTTPFGMTALEMNSWMQHGGGQALLDELYAPFNLVAMPAGNSGMQMAGWFNKEINSLGDLKGLKMRIPGLGGEVLARAGGTPVMLPGGEIFTALQTGIIDATEWVGPYNDLAFGLQKAAKYYYYPGWHEPGSLIELIINKDAYTSLPKDLQAIVRTAAQAANEQMLVDMTAHNMQALKKLKTDFGVEPRPLPNDVLMKLKEISAQVLAEVAASDAMAQKVYQSQKAFSDDIKAYHEVSDKAFLNVR